MKVSRAATLAIKNLGHHQVGKCNICGKSTIFICIDTKTVRNNMYCPFCQSSSRKRHVAKLLISKIFTNISSLVEISAKNNLDSVSIYNTDVDDAFYQVLHNSTSYYCSSCIPNVQIGTEISEQVSCQDLEKLSFADENFDVVITEDVFEHIRDYEKAFFEVYRILKTGGYHIFTVPCFFDKPTLVRVDTSGAEDIHLLPPEYHGDRIRGKILAYRTFGIDIFEILEKIGFETTVDFSNYLDRRYGIFDSYAFCSRKL
ncbi:methylase involved in ubiquinone/menaquinone biosynthesis [Rivularia sp. PCC 7116]|uniref:class I SAM-dependent methyltransferase n=1 Tax=Rivularia sp. PCC 7116 TaxID=373994 RepID=UPI00029ED9E9|nr:class I SAM-dependent methyltransferase [Rivularia sp. PCC 7116]AFY53056.1 methylase involved in ubiquinone/menaquinone biosynthesis [Rivularia sp. PCC 7116]